MFQKFMERAAFVPNISISARSPLPSSECYRGSIGSSTLIYQPGGAFPALGLWPNPSVFIIEPGQLWAWASRLLLSTSCLLPFTLSPTKWDIFTV